MLVFGSEGLLGSHLCALYKLNGISHSECDITDVISTYKTIKKYMPITTVINCAGIVPRHPNQNNIFRSNALGPKNLQIVCDELGVKLIQISTDCVFTGNHGPYSEKAIPNPPDNYGLSKYLGEVEAPHLTIRTSFVGWPDPKGRGLLAWFYEQESINGYAQYLWSGLTTTELSSIIMQCALDPDGTSPAGLFHVAGECINKYMLLNTVNEIYGWNKLITPVDNPVVNRMLTSNYEYYVTDKSFRQMVEEMREKEDIVWAYLKSI